MSQVDDHGSCLHAVSRRLLRSWAQTANRMGVWRDNARNEHPDMLALDLDFATHGIIHCIGALRYNSERLQQFIVDKTRHSPNLH